MSGMDVDAIDGDFCCAIFMIGFDKDRNVFTDEKVQVFKLSNCLHLGLLL
jgi:hypothetical protein